VPLSSDQSNAVGHGCRASRHTMDPLVRRRLSTISDNGVLCRLCKASTISCRLWWYRSANASRFFHTSSMISSWYMVYLLRKKFLWCADFRAHVTGKRTDGPDQGLRVRIVDVLAVPCQQEVHRVNRRQGNVQGVELRRRREPAVGNQLGRKGLDFGIDRKFRHAVQRGSAAP